MSEFHFYKTAAAACLSQVFNLFFVLKKFKLTHVTPLILSPHFAISNVLSSSCVLPSPYCIVSSTLLVAMDSDCPPWPIAPSVPPLVSCPGLEMSLLVGSSIRNKE